MNIYFIGGSPCSGKSTVAERLSSKYNLRYFKVDERLESYIALGAARGFKTCAEIAGMGNEETWMREPAVQCREELDFYAEVFGLVMDDINALEADNVVAEGAAYLPSLMKSAGVSRDRYISVTPTKDFQVFHYSKREWIGMALEGCADKKKAFENWMERDALFALEVQGQCRETGYASIVNDGGIGIDKLESDIAAHFGLGD